MNAVKQLVDVDVSSSACHRISSLRRNLLVATYSVLAVMLVAGTNTALSQTAHFGGAQTTLASGFANPSATAVDGSGNVYVADYAHSAIKEILAINGSIPASPAVQTLGGVFNGPVALAVDGNGNLYVAGADGTIKQVLAVNGSIPASPSIVTLTQIAQPQGLAADASGNLYVSGGCQGSVPAGTRCGFVEEFLAVNGAVSPASTVAILPVSPSGPGGVAVDRGGNVYVADTGNSQVDEILATNGAVTINSVSRVLINLSHPGGIAVDHIGNLFVSVPSTNTVYEVQTGNGSNSASAVGTGFSLPLGVAVDGNENVYVADFANNRVVEISLSGGSFGAVSAGTTSQSVTLNFTFATAGKLGGTAILTQGISGLDFAAGAGSCAANTTYAAGQTCTVKVTFTPGFAGIRSGAALLYASNGSVIATGYVQGTGVAPQMNFLPATQSIVYSGSSSVAPQAVAVDANGNVFVGTGGGAAVLKELASSGTYTSAGNVGTNLTSAYGVAIDGAGNIYIADPVGNTVYKETLTQAGYSQSTIGNGLSQPHAVAVDGSGNVYISDTGSGQVYKESLTPTGYSQSALPASGLSSPGGVAVDGSGNVYIVDVYNGRVLQETISQGTYSQSTVVSGLGQPQGIAVDSGGNVYVTDLQSNQVLKETSTPSGFVQTTVANYANNGVLQPTGVAVDSLGNVYIAEAQNFQVLKENSSNPPALTFANAVPGATSPDSPQTVTVENIGNSALTFPIPSTGSNPSIAANFTLTSNTTTACPLITATSTTAGTLAAGASCQLPISFAPATPGSASGSLVLTDTNLNAAATTYSSQSIPLSGTGIQITPTITWSVPAAITYGTPLSDAQLNATSSVAGTFSYSISEGALLGAGQQTLTATFTPTDTIDYTTATATVTLTITQAVPSITWSTPVAISYGTTLNAAQLNAASTVAGSFAYSPAIGTTLSAGSQTLIVTFTPTDLTDYTAATATVSVTVTQATPAITWASPASISYGTPLSATQLNATSTLPGTFVYSPAAGAVLGGGSQTLTVTFTPTDAVDYTTATYSVIGTVNKATPALTWATPPAIAYGTSLSATQLNATSTVAGSFSYSPATGTILTAGSHTLTATFTPADSTDYVASTATVFITVNKTTPAINWPTPAAITYGTALSATQLGATSPVAGNFIYSPPAGTILSVGSQTLNVTFTPTDSADYTTATGSVVLTVNPAPSFTLAASPTALSIAQGASGTSSLTVTGHNGFTGSASLTVSGLPSGVTASFSPNLTAGSSVLTLTAGSSVVPGMYSLTINGTSGSLTATTAIALTITAAQSGFACHVVYSVTSQWAGGFGTAITINNTGTKAITNWTLTWTYANGQKVTQIWNGNVTQSGANVTVTNMSYNGTISPGGSYTGMGFNGTWNNQTNSAPTSFSVNGTVCR